MSSSVSVRATMLMKCMMFTRVALTGRNGASKPRSTLNRLSGKSDASGRAGDDTEFEAVVAALSSSGKASFMFSPDECI